MKKRILLIDSNCTFSEKLKKILEEKGYEMYIVTGIQEAVELVKKALPQIIFIDMETPPDNALETYLKIREISEETPVVIVAEGWDDLKDLAWEEIMHSTYACLYKPFKIEEMLELIEIIIEKPVLKKCEKIKKPEKCSNWFFRRMNEKGK